MVFQRDPALTYLLGRAVFLTQGCEVCQALRAEDQKASGVGTGLGWRQTLSGPDLELSRLDEALS